MKKQFLIVLSLIVLVKNNSNVLKCGEQEIENCIECDKGSTLGACAKCQDNYFLFFHNLMCIACNNETFGQIGCEGNCDGSRFTTDRFAYCNKDDCKEGYYNLNGLCFRCSEGSPGCKKCIITSEKEEEDPKYICQECLSNEYNLTEYGYCVHCSLQYCEKCHFDAKGSALCDKCLSGFYLNSVGDCKKCHDPVDIENGKCRVCSDIENDYNSGPCWCNPHYVKSNHSTCISCPDNCDYCEYNNATKEAECVKCNYQYTVNSQKTCTYCGDGCEICSINNNSEIVCEVCSSRTFNEGGKCLACPNNCRFCNLDENKKIKCTQCYEGNILNKKGECENCPSQCRACHIENEQKICDYCFDSNDIININQECIKCSSTPDIGKGCERCGYNKKTSKYECYQCKKRESEYDYTLVDIYAYITNEYKCLNNTDPNDKYLYGCLTATYDEVNKKYECLNCKSGFIPIINEKKCRRQWEMSLNSNCLEAENLEDEQNPKYSCTKCTINSVNITTYDNRIDCYNRKGKLAYCLKGEEKENHELNCTTCVDNSNLNESAICQCDSDSFGKYDEWCYKCDDKYYGNPGCNISEGCQYYYPNDQLDCNQCKINFFPYTRGQCYSCEFEIENCNQCHFDESNQTLICDKCEEGYTYVSNEKKCLLINCEEYPEIYPGCIICDNQLEEYKSKKICHSCKNGYFKTKENTCIYCRSENYGGPSCFKCGYEEDTNNIACQHCPIHNHLLTSDGKCYNCKLNSLNQNCQLCKLVKGDKGEKLQCTLCDPGYSLNDNGECINYSQYIKWISHCQHHIYQINNITLSTYYFYHSSNPYDNYSYYSIIYNYTNHNNDYYHYSYNSYRFIYDYLSGAYHYYNAYEYRLNNTNVNIKISNINYTIDTECYECETGYYKNLDGNCLPVNDNSCSLYSIIQNFPQRYQDCKKICYNSNYAYINLIIKNNSINCDEQFDEKCKNSIELNMVNLFDAYYYDYHYDLYDLYGRNLSSIFFISGIDLTDLFIKKQLCVNTSTFPGNFTNCKIIEYSEILNNYKCIECIYDYYLDNNTNTCYYDYIEDIEDNNNLLLEGTNPCYFENKGNNTNPIYSCTKCFNRNDVLVTAENNYKYCISQKNGLENCLEAVSSNTSYINPIYNCIACTMNYIPYYSEFFGRKICQNIYGDLIEEKQISLDNFIDVDNVTSNNGTCENKYFTPDGIKCYQCNNPKVGMKGCEGSCSFSLKRNDILKCEGECKKGYIESSPGICQLCSSIIEGCGECHYEENNLYPSNYKGIKRKAKLVCDNCDDNYNEINGTCYEKGLYHCEDFNNYECKTCEVGYVLENNDCHYCNYEDTFINNNKCYDCSNDTYGGINNCIYCENDNGQIICQQCEEGYIFLKSNSSCIYRNNNKELEKFDSCEILNFENNILYCTRCKPQYSLIKINNEQKCEYIPLLYDDYYYDYFDYHRDYFDYYYYYLQRYRFYDYYYDYYYYDYYYNNDYYYYSNYNLYPCQEAINLGNESYPIYSCNKCYQFFEYDKANLYGTFFTKIINERNNISICVRTNRQLINCTEAVNKTRDGIEKYDCLKCNYNNELVYDKELNISFCQYENKIEKCMVKYCRTCKNNDNYFCSICTSSNYEVNSLTGSCVNKTDVIPAITWKDIFRLQMNSNKTINGRTIYGPSLILRGITSSQINTRHAFLIYLTFKIKTRNYRNLNEEKRIPTICEVENDVQETDNNTNIVDYECIGNSTEDENLEDYELYNIEDGEDNSGLLKSNNLADIVSQTNLKELENKYYSNFTLSDLLKIVTFKMDEIKDIISSDYNFEFEIKGTINKKKNPVIINDSLELYEVEEKVDCNFIIEENQTAYLKCKINLENYTNVKVFSFRTYQIKDEENEIYLANINKMRLIYGGNKTNGYDENTDTDEGEFDEGMNSPKVQSEKKKKNYIVLIICIVVGVPLLIGISFLIYYLIKKNKSHGKNDDVSKTITNTNNNINNSSYTEHNKTTDELQ